MVKGIKAMDFLDDFIENIEPENIPTEYITMAKIIDIDGNEVIIRGGKELDDYLNDPDNKIIEFSFILNRKKLKQAIIKEYKIFTDKLDKRFQA
jgi:hypothetical protein